MYCVALAPCWRNVAHRGGVAIAVAYPITTGRRFPISTILMVTLTMAVRPPLVAASFCSRRSGALPELAAAELRVISGVPGAHVRSNSRPFAEAVYEEAQHSGSSLGTARE